MKLLESIEDYLRFLQFEQGVSKTTYKSYHAYLFHFHKWLIENGYPSPELKDYNTTTLRRYFYYVSGKGLRPRSIYGYMVPLRSYGAFLVEHGVLTENPASSIKLPKKDAAIRRETSEEEILAMWNAVTKQRNQYRAVMQKAVLAVLIYTGLRRAEVCDLKLTDADLADGWLLVRSGKGSKSRKVPLCTEAIDALAMWLGIRPADCQHDYLFSVDRSRRLYYTGIRSIVEEVKHLAGLADKTHICPHSLRHSCASRLMRNGASLHEVMTWLGHTQISTTQRYLHTNEMELKSTASFASLAPQAKENNATRPPQGEERQARYRRVTR
ncbi:tyrosine recombinase XerD [Armatimonadota bacterium]|nr:tyrosine recombinase XerD [Armatimonadota bacterium]